MHIPAVCDTCGNIFPSGIYVENATNVSFSGNTAGPCPSCGGMGHIPDGVYNFIHNTIELVAGPSRTFSELERLAQLLTEARQLKLSYNDIAESIIEDVPELSSLKDILPKTRNDLYAFITLVLTIISLFLSQRNQSDNQRIEVNQVLNIVYQQTSSANSQITQSIPVDIKNPLPTVSKKTKTGRNDPCPCGSGKKYKKCCLP